MQTRLVLLMAVLCVTAQAGSFYQLDDGVSEESLGCAGGNHCWSVWLNEFTAQPGALTITAIELAYGSLSNSGFAPPDGTPVTVYLWTDPGNTGNPVNAVVQRSVATTMANVDTDIFNVVPIAPITLSAGQIFYVGAISRTETTFPASYDTTNPQHHSFEGIWDFFTLGDSPDPNQLGSALDFSNTDTILPGNLMVRADVQAPEPSTSWLLTALGCGLAWRKRRNNVR
jgi:hypothetical protein